jgi:polar amino acid transport system substrate-binding protein
MRPPPLTHHQRQRTSWARWGRVFGVLTTSYLIGAAVSFMPARADDAVRSGATAKALTICAIADSMPRMGKTADDKPIGLDVNVVEHVARILGRSIEFHWCAGAQCAWHCLPEGRCDVVIGQPQNSGPAREVAWSVPYAGAQFGLVVPRGSRASGSLEDFRGKRIGIVAGTVAISEKDHVVIKFKSREELLDGFAGALLEVAFVDADFASWHLHGHPQLGLRILADYVPRERWNMALAVRARDSQLLVEINRALGQLAASGEIRRAYQDMGVPFHPPFSGAVGKEPARDTWRRIRDRDELIVCADPANLPYSSAKNDLPGFDVELARALAKRLDVKLRIDWLDALHETAVGQLLQRECDLVFGEPVATNLVADDEELAGKLVYSQPYYRTGYMLVERKNGPHIQSLAELKGAKSQRLGAEAGSVADYSLRQRGYLRRLFRNQLATLNALNEGDIDYAYLWANVGWALHNTPEWKLELVPNYVPEDHWNIAVAMGRGDNELKHQVDAALAALIKDGTVGRALARYHMPYYAPVVEPHHRAQSDDAGTIKHRVADRGLEPQMQKIQASKSAYSGLARVRSAGEIVVGLDQNNLPFSTAHPEPAGLDYEIAELLAKEMGVRLRVFWAYSSHDSYPSKLTRGLCDVLLGVTPDDRFEKRVKFSRPYYSAKYQMVVATGQGPPTIEAPLGVEEGVALRGLAERKVRAYSSTEAILEAVAAGRAPAGYVISTRASWLANERWPGKLTFLVSTEASDCFPICAAVRKSDGDLKDAIDNAWDTLQRSGKLAQVFSRWHIPFEPSPDAHSTKGNDS